MDKLKRNKGITLISLIVTIIILIIIAGISILTLTNNGIVDRAKFAKELTENAQIEENTTLAKYENTIDKYINNHRESSTSGYEYLENGTVIETSDKYNGKIIKKVCITNTIYSTDSKFADLSSYNIDVILDISGYAIVDEGRTIAKIGCWYTSEAFIDFFYDIPSKYLHSRVGSQYNGGTAHIIITFTEK